MGRASAGRFGDGLFGGEARLLDVQAIKPASTGVAEQYDLVEAGTAQKLQAGGDVVQGEFVLESQIVADRSRRLGPGGKSSLDDIRHEVLAGHEFTRVHASLPVVTPP